MIESNYIKLFLFYIMTDNSFDKVSVHFILCHIQVHQSMREGCSFVDVQVFEL